MIKQVTRFVFNRAIFLYIIIVALTCMLFDVPATIETIKYKTLDRLRPEPHYMGRFLEGQGTIDHAQLDNYIFYYEKVIDYIHDRADVFGMLGFCYYQKGEKQKAIEHLKVAIQLNPNFFWYYYDLGVIYSRYNEYDKAAHYFEKAISAPKQYTIAYLIESVIYNHIMAGSSIKKEGNISERLNEDYLFAAHGLVLCYYHLGQYQKMLDAALNAIRVNVKSMNQFYYYAGLASYHDRQYQRAAAYFQESIRRDASIAEAYYYLSLTLMAAGERLGSQRALKRSELLREMHGSQLPSPEDFIVKIF